MKGEAKRSKGRRNVPSMLRISRMSAGFSQDELSIITGIDPSRLSRIERGYREARPGERVLISRALRKNERELFPLRPAAEA